MAGLVHVGEVHPLDEAADVDLAVLVHVIAAHPHLRDALHRPDVLALQVLHRHVIDVRAGREVSLQMLLLSNLLLH